jgi:4-amino-4-deoxy-L-arabinose transferase-like glycosyltransferase
MTPGDRADVSRTAFAAILTAILVIAALLRFVYPTADPPWRATVGIVWHDEGAWVHNARNKALFGAWRLDEWNPIFVAPVFTGLEYLSFAALGVGLWQARLVSQIAGLASVLVLGLAVRRAGGRPAGLFAAGLLATNFVYVMWNRAALLETTMVAFLVAGFYAYVRALTEPPWGIVAGMCAWLAFYSKAAAVFFLPALAVAAFWPVIWRVIHRDRASAASPADVRAGWYTLFGLALGGALGLLLVAPHWQEYWFYNWQTSVTRKPSYTFESVMDRTTWFPILHDSFTRMWFILIVSIGAMLAALARWRPLVLRAQPSSTPLPGADRLLLAWVAVGVLELLLHDVGNERRLLFLVPAMCGLAAIALGRDGRLFPSTLADIPRTRALLAAPFALYAAYVALGPLGRLPFLYEVRPAVRLSAAAAVGTVVLIYAAWPAAARFAARGTIGRFGAGSLVALVMAGDVAQFVQWARERTYRNYMAMKVVAERIPAETLVHGKLANGLSLESRIRPVFVGREFGNYTDRLHRGDIKYVLTYISPRVGYEGPVIRDVLNAYPDNRVLWTVPVAESTCGCDAAALVAKHATPQTAWLPVLSRELDSDGDGSLAADSDVGQ